jgi:hypothetical protein
MEHAPKDFDDQHDNPKLIRLFPDNRDEPEEVPVITDPEGPRHPLMRKLVSIISIIIVFAICIYLLRLPLSGLFSSKLYITLAAENTIKSLNRELMAFATENNVIKRGADLFAVPNEQTLHVSAGAFGLNNEEFTLTALNDNKRNLLTVGLTNDSGKDAGFYLSDSLMGLWNGFEAYSTDPSKAGGQINSALDAGGVGLRLPEDLDMSYSAFKRFLTGGSLSAVAPAYDRLRIRYGDLARSLLDVAKFKKSSQEKLSMGAKTINCKAVSMQISGQDMKTWLGTLADTIRDDQDLDALIGHHKGDLENMVRRRQFFHSGTVFIKLFCYGDRIVSARYSHEESQAFFEVSTLGESYRLDNISFIMSGVREAKFQAVSDHPSHDSIHVNLFAKGLGALDWLDQLQVVWEPGKESGNVTLGKAGRIINQFTLAGNDSGVWLDIPSAGNGGASIAYTLTELYERPEWPEDVDEVPGISMDWLRAILE